MVDRIQHLDYDYGPRVEQLKEKALDMAAVAKERLAQGTDVVRDYTQNQPVRALGVAIGLGVLLGWLIKRR